MCVVVFLVLCFSLYFSCLLVLFWFSLFILFLYLFVCVLFSVDVLFSCVSFVVCLCCFVVVVFSSSPILGSLSSLPRRRRHSVSSINRPPSIHFVVSKNIYAPDPPSKNYEDFWLWTERVAEGAWAQPPKKNCTPKKIMKKGLHTVSPHTDIRSFAGIFLNRVPWLQPNCPVGDLLQGLCAELQCDQAQKRLLIVDDADRKDGSILETALGELLENTSLCVIITARSPWRNDINGFKACSCKSQIS